MVQPRGIRNCNPGNIRLSNTQWRGASPTQTDTNFVQFVSMDYGLRAIAKILMAYHTIHGVDTIRGIINKWAPPIENLTGAYVRDVASRAGIAADAALTFDAPTLVKLVQAICDHECGAANVALYITPAQFTAGVALAVA